MKKAHNIELAVYAVFSSQPRKGKHAKKRHIGKLSALVAIKKQKNIMKIIASISILIGSIICMLLLSLGLSSNVQSNKQVPQSFKYKLSDNVPIIELPITEDSVQRYTEWAGTTAYIDIFLAANYSLQEMGSWDTLPKGGRIWRVNLHKKGAPALGVLIDELKMPSGAYFFAYSKDKKFVVGPISEFNAKYSDLSYILLRHIIGDEVTIEYFEPAEAYQQSHFVFDDLIYCIGANPPSMTQKLKKKIPFVEPIPKDSLKAWIKRNETIEYGMFGRGGWNVKNSGTWETLKNGDRVWRLELDGRHLPRVANTSVFFKKDSFYIPNGAALYLYRPDKTDVVGPITDWDDMVKKVAGNTVILEYYEPKNVRNQGWFEIFDVEYQLKITAQKDINCGSCSYCTARVRCSDTHGNDIAYIPSASTNIQAAVDGVKNSVIKITCLYSPPPSTNQQPCTGTLMRSATDPNSFYVLTAGHCLFKGFWRASTNATNNKVPYFRFRFDYEYQVNEAGTACSKLPLEGELTSIGGTIIATSPQPSNGNTDARSDFALIKLNSLPKIPANRPFNYHYAGWDNNQGLPTAGIGIHHPQGYDKRVCVQDDALNTGCSGNNGIKPFLSNEEGSSGFQKDKIENQNGDRFAVTFDRGIIMSGSSGSPFFNTQGRVIGQLKGTIVNNCCASLGTEAQDDNSPPAHLDSNCNSSSIPPFKQYNNGNNERYNAYGRLWYSWSHGYDSNGNGIISDEEKKTSTLQPWLDPNNSETDGILEGLTASNCDIYLKDCANDQAAEPCNDCTISSTFFFSHYDVWKSPDLWNNIINVDDPSDIVNNTHEDPDFGNAATNSLSNMICFRVHNNGTCPSDPAFMRLYWAMASTGQSWPNDFIQDDSDICFTSNEITTDSPISVPSIAPSATYQDTNLWFPPNFTDPTADEFFYPYHNPNECGILAIPSIENPHFELSLLARLTSWHDPITEEREGAILNNVLNSNNIVIRNSFTIDPFEINPDGTVAVGGYNSQPGRSSLIWIVNNNSTVVTMDLAIKQLSSGDPNYLNDIMKLEMTLSDELWQKWADAGLIGEGIDIIEDKKVEVTNLETAKLNNLQFIPNEKQALGIQVKIITSSGKRPANNIPNEYEFMITHDPVEMGLNPPSPCFFKVENLQKYASVESPPQHNTIITIPNPIGNITNVIVNMTTESVATIQVFNVEGKLVQVIANNNLLTQGQHNFLWNTDKLINGAYFIRLQTANEATSYKVLKIK